MNGKKLTDPIIVLTGLCVGLAALVLTKFGNPANMGFCIACFLRDIAGAVGLHHADKVQYVRPEIVGIVVGSFLIALANGEFRPKAGSSPATRFVIGMIVVIGALVFLGCPLRMVIRLGGGDFNAITALGGFIVGILIGVYFINKGFSLKRSYDVTMSEGFVLPVSMMLMLILFISVPALFLLSKEGPGAKHAPMILSFVIALVVGVLAQKSRLCTVGGIRDFILFRDTRLLSAFVVIFLTVLVGNLALGSFKAGFALQPVSHSSHIWNFAGMVLVGWGSVMLGGCPFRQLVLASEGNGDSAVTVIGMIVGAAFAHNFKLAGNPDKLNEAKQLVVGGISTYGKAAVIACFIILLGISLLNISKSQATK
ncbi:selenium metabolism protein, YedE family [Peptostreptococcaceae bacterium AS15]|nr:selenium metabolism protein, YedE family [Peptostreptococcaceae bacterium AS15]